ncbi:unnamed protein product [Aphanomyces euteiches]
MEQFVSVLALVLTDDPVATGRELFEAFESAVPTSNRPIVAYMHMDIRFFSNQVDKDYLVIHIIWHSTPVYFHNVYAPVEDDQRAAFFKSLPVDFGDDDTGIHVVGGDFKLPMTTSLGATIPPSNYNAGKADCLAWLAALCVTDAWRLMYPSKPAHSGPRRKNRFDYTFVDRELATFHLHKSTYDTNRFHGDQLTHTVSLMASPSTPRPQPSSKLWRLPRELLLDHQTIKAIYSPKPNPSSTNCLNSLNATQEPSGTTHETKNAPGPVQ